jgi:hypothetical protein
MNINLKNQLSLLAQLAKSDKKLDDNEKQWLHTIGASNRLSSTAVDLIINRPDGGNTVSKLGLNHRFEFLFNTIQLMKTDRKRYFKEIGFCRRTAERLGFNTTIVNELSMNIYNDRLLQSSVENVRYNVKKYLLS